MLSTACGCTPISCGVTSNSTGSFRRCHCVPVPPPCGSSTSTSPQSPCPPPPPPMTEEQPVLLRLGPPPAEPTIARVSLQDCIPAVRPVATPVPGPPGRFPDTSATTHPPTCPPTPTNQRLQRTNRRHWMPSPYSAIARDRLSPGVARHKRVFAPTRDQYIHHGIYTPSNRWRRAPKQRPGNPMLQRPLILAQKLPWLPQYNFARS